MISPLPVYSQPGGLIEGSPGMFYSVALLAGTGSPAVFSVTAKGSTLTLTSFPSGYNFSGFPVSGPNGRFYDGVEYLSDPGNLFSVTVVPGVQQYPTQAIRPGLTQNLPDGTFLGAGNKPGTGWSVLISDQDGNVTAIYSFPSKDLLLFPVIYASDGNYLGVDVINAADYIYRVTPAGSLKNMHNFNTSAFRGSTHVPLFQASDGNLYGAAPYGGADGTGVIYKLSLTGQYSAVYTFPKTPAGYPTALIQASDGNFYGTTSGNTQAAKGHSVLFRLTPSGEFTQLFAWPASACNCYLTQGADGKIYGIAQYFAQGFFVWDGGLPKPPPRAPQFTPQSGPAGTLEQIWGYKPALGGRAIQRRGGGLGDSQRTQLRLRHRAARRHHRTDNRHHARRDLHHFHRFHRAVNVHVQPPCARRDPCDAQTGFPA
jgi:uncharacterized repeat protein (TIGR03803 family)